MGPRFSGVGRLVHAVALGDVRAHVRFAGAHVDGVVIRRSNGQRSNRADRLGVENRLPGAAGVSRLPHAPVDAAEVKVLRLSGNAADRENTARAKRSDEPPLQILKKSWIDGGDSARHTEQECEKTSHAAEHIIRRL